MFSSSHYNSSSCLFSYSWHSQKGSHQLQEGQGWLQIALCGNAERVHCNHSSNHILSRPSHGADSGDSGNSHRNSNHHFLSHVLHHSLCE
uniref:Uncharacterized protein n=1 Tax=Cucumis melo TaxID=3656 RepID=A0A9I9EFP5_CUCME